MDKDNYTIDVLEIFEDLEREGSRREAEAVLTDALEKIEEPFPRWIFAVNLAGFYYRNHMYLKMDKVSKLLRKEFPDNYVGCQIHLFAEKERGHFDEAGKYMETLAADFSRHPQYHMDYINLLDEAGKPEEALAYIDDNISVMELIPQFALAKKIGLLNRKNEREGLESLLVRLVSEYDDIDAANSVMILYFLRGEFERSARIAKAVLKKDAGARSFRSYLAYCFQIANLYMLCDRKPDARVKAWMRKALDWIIDYIDQAGTDDPDLNQLIEEIERMLAEDES